MNPTPGAEAARWAEEVFGPGGSVASAMPGFEHRPQQVEMAARVRQTFAAGRMALIEAGTGTGKSLAYLYPGLLHARLAGGPLIVSTNTINLQEQLLRKDLPLLAALCPGAPPKTALLLGRGNYLCRRRLEYALRQGTLDLPAEILSGLVGAARQGRGERNRLGIGLPDEAWRLSGLGRQVLPAPPLPVVGGLLLAGGPPCRRRGRDRPGQSPPAPGRRGRAGASGLGGGAGGPAGLQPRGLRRSPPSRGHRHGAFQPAPG